MESSQSLLRNQAQKMHVERASLFTNMQVAHRGGLEGSMSNQSFFRQPTPEDHPGYNHGKTGWYLNVVNSRNDEIARYLGLPSVYCVGQYPGKVLLPKVVYIQPTRSVDSNTKQLGYVVVDNPEHIRAVLRIIRRPYNADEVQRRQAEDDILMDMARRKVL